MKKASGSDNQSANFFYISIVHFIPFAIIDCISIPHFLKMAIELFRLI
jgi:hypothetical protein